MDSHKLIQLADEFTFGKAARIATNLNKQQSANLMCKPIFFVAKEPTVISHRQDTRGQIESMKNSVNHDNHRDSSDKGRKTMTRLFSE